MGLKEKKEKFLRMSRIKVLCHSMGNVYVCTSNVIILRKIKTNVVSIDGIKSKISNYGLEVE